MTKILITGGAGYIGSNVADTLVKEGFNGQQCEIFIVDNLLTGHKRLLNSAARFFEIDLTNLEGLSRVFSEVRPEIVLHFAGVSQVGESNCDPGKYYKNNVFGSLCLLRAMVDNDCKKIVFSSSAAVYGEPQEVPITEEHQLKPLSVYGETKILIEDILKYFDSVYGVKFLSLRYFNAGGASSDGKYGEIHEPETHLIPSILKVVKNGGEFKLFGDDYETKDGTCVRDYIHVEDLARAHVLGTEYLIDGGESKTVNLGTGKGYSVEEIVEVCRKISKRNFKVNVIERRVGDPAVLVASNKRAADLLGWKPKKGIEEIVESAWMFEEKL